MLSELDQSLRSSLPALLKDRNKWDSLIVNRRKPHTYRVFTTLENGNRICLHKFNPCDMHEAFSHPHGWPAAFVVLQGGYKMEIGLYQSRESNEKTKAADFIMGKWSAYQFSDPLTWHTVVPLEVTYTIMVNGRPFSPEIAHCNVRTTAGKDLDKMPEVDLIEHLDLFKRLVAEYIGGVKPYEEMPPHG